jgi:HlyD family secretion protein
VDDAQALLSTDVTNLSKASIRSPIDGVVLTRSVEPGNAVAASLQAVTLFTVAEDLTRLRLQVNVDEADVGSVKVDQKASFTVSAYPRAVPGHQVTRVSFGSTKTDNVVTYITWLEVDNSDLSLRPGMTAAATITSTERNDVLLVPNTALRFTAVAAGAAARRRKSSGGGIMSQLMPRMPARARAGRAKRPAADGAGRVRRCGCSRDGAVAMAVNVQVGISDGRMTEVTAKALRGHAGDHRPARCRGRAMSEPQATGSARGCPRCAAPHPPARRDQGVWRRARWPCRRSKGWIWTLPRAILWPSWAPAVQANPPP